MSELPAPLTAADTDLRDFSFMPLDVARLRDSDLASLESREACWTAVLLWCASWHQVPAGSLPDNDRILCKMANFGDVLDAWLRMRDGALRGWIKCSDGRLYHPTVCEKAREAWAGKLKYAADKEADRIRKAEKRAGGPKKNSGGPKDPTPDLFDNVKNTASGGSSDLSGGQDGVSSGNGDQSDDKADVSDGNPAETPLIGTGTGTGINKEPPNPRGEGETHDHASGINFSADFQRAWLAYPPRAGNANKKGAWKAWEARLKQRATSDEMIAGVLRYAAYIRFRGKENTEFVQLMATFLGPDEHFKEPWTIPPSASVVSLRGMSIAERSALDEEEAFQQFGSARIN